MPTITLDFTPADAARIKAAQETELQDNTMSDAEHIALFKSKLLRFARQYVRKQEYKMAVKGVTVPDDIVGT